jgi:hypothetical protein
VIASKLPDPPDQLSASAEDTKTPAVPPSCGNLAAGAATAWPRRPRIFPDLLTPTEAAQYLRLDELGTHTPETAIRTLNYWRDRKQLNATKYARHVWYRKSELDRFLSLKTES